MRGTKLYAMFAAMFMAGAFLASPELRAYAANTVFSTDIKDGEVKTPDLANNAVTSAKIKDGEVKTDDIAPSAIGSLRIKDNDVKAQDIAPNAVGASEIADGTLAYADASRSFVKIEHRDDCNCGGTGWDPNGTTNVGFVHDDSITINSVLSISMTKTSLMCTPNHWTDGIIQVICDRNIAAGTGINYAVFNK
jgi:hypothetical protein